jgi:hypothetical protein
MDNMKPATADFALALSGLNRLLSSSFKALLCQP